MSTSTSGTGWAAVDAPGASSSPAAATTAGTSRLPYPSAPRASQRTSTPGGASSGSTSAASGTSSTTVPRASRGSRSQMLLIAGTAVSSPASSSVPPVGRSKLDPAVVAVEAGIRPDQGDLVADAGPPRPARRRATVAVQHQVDVDLGQVRADRPHRVGADRVAQVLGQGPPRRVPVRAVRQGRPVLTGQRQRQLDPLVVTVVGEAVQVRPGEGHPGEGRAQAAYRADGDGEHAPRGDGQGLGHGASLGLGPASTGWCSPRRGSATAARRSTGCRSWR